MESKESRSWTDDLPSCTNCGIGSSTNQSYREDGTRFEYYAFRDRSFHCKVDDNTSLYAIFSGHCGAKVAELAIQRMAAEILLGQLKGKISDEDVKEVLKQAFYAVENGYIDSIDNIITKKLVLLNEIPENLSQYEITQQHQSTLDKINEIHQELKIGASVVLVLIYYSKLYICNTGNCRALLCKNDSNNVLRVVQLSVDHNLQNEDEILRLCQLGLDIQLLKTSPLESTRCIGNYLGKSGYKDCDYLYAANSEPILSDPEIIGGIQIDNSCRFLLLLSSGMCQTLEDIFSTESSQINKEVIQMTVEQFRSQSTLMGVAQSVVHKIVQLHHDIYMQEIQENNTSNFRFRKDVTFVVRNFNFPLPNAIQKRNSQVRFNPVIREHSNFINFNDTEMRSVTESSSSNMDTNDSSSSSEQSDTHIIYDKNKKTTSYVDFTDYFKRVEEAKKTNNLPVNIEFD